MLIELYLKNKQNKQKNPSLSHPIFAMKDFI